MNEVKSVHQAWLLMNQAYWHLRYADRIGNRDALAIVNKLAGELFEEMFKEEAA